MAEKKRPVLTKKEQAVLSVAAFHLENAGSDEAKIASALDSMEQLLPKNGKAAKFFRKALKPVLSVKRAKKRNTQAILKESNDYLKALDVSEKILKEDPVAALVPKEVVGAYMIQVVSMRAQLGLSTGLLGIVSLLEDVFKK